MIAYFPMPYLGELFYSLIARFRHHTMLTQSEVSYLFYGNRDITFSTLLPTQLNNFCSNTSHLFELTPQDILNTFTIWPYLSSFIKSQSHSEILRLVAADAQRGKLATLIGLNGSDVYMHRIPKYCPVCFLDSVRTDGEAFWHREHQIPNILICTTHNCFLKDPNLNFTQLAKQPVLTPTDLICSPSVRYNSNLRICEVAGLMRQVLLGNAKLNFNYREQAIEKGYTRHGFIAQDVLEKQFLKYYSERTIDSFFQSTIRKVPKLCLDNLVNRPARIFNPMKHLLLQNFFQKTGRTSRQDFYLLGGYDPSKYSRVKRHRGGRPGGSRFRNQKTGRDFSEVEDRILARLENELERLKKTNVNKRISSSYLSRVAAVSPYDAGLRRVKAYLINASETIESFQARRVHRAFLKIRREGRKLTASNVLKYAAVFNPSHAILDLVKQLIRSQFENLPMNL